jgi:glycolate oxidase FAD binding subunit
MAAAGAAGHRLMVQGAGTKSAWGRPAPAPEVLVEMAGLNGVVEYNPGDLTAVVRAGTPLATLQAVLAEEGQMLALDPPALNGDSDGATVGGVVATGDSGPLRHRFGGVRDLILGITVVLSDGTVARAGGKVIKNVAGYDLGKLFAGSFGTLGLIGEVSVRLHPVPRRTATVVGRGGDRSRLAAAAGEAASVPLAADCLDVAWAGDGGAILVRIGADDPGPRLDRAATLLAAAGLEVETLDGGDGDGDVWADQRAGQRSEDGTVVRISARPSELGAVLDAAADAGAAVVGRAGLGLSWLRLPEAPADEVAATVASLRQRLEPAAVVVLDASEAVRATVDPWGPRTGPVSLMRRVKKRFDPAGVCRPGVFVDGI